MTGEGGLRWPRGSFLGLLGTADQAALMRLGTQRTFTRDQVLIREGATDRDVHLLLRGCVKVRTVTAEGEAAVLAVRLPGDLVGELAAIDGKPRSATVVTATTTTVRVIGHAEFERHSAANPAVATAVRATVTAKLRQATRLRAGQASHSPMVRLARLIDDLGTTYGIDSPSGRLLDVRLAQLDLAALIGVGQASVERALGELRRRRLVRTGYRQILVTDLAGLRDLAAEVST